MMLDISWGVGLASGPSMTAVGGMGMGFPDGIADDEMEGMINDLGFFQDKDDVFEIKNDVLPETTRSGDENVVENEKATSKNLPIVTNDTGAVVTVSTPRDVRSLNFATTVISPVALPQPPQLVSLSPSDQESVESVLEQQRQTILQNKKILEAQRIKLEGKNHTTKPAMILPKKKCNENVTKGTKRKTVALASTTATSDQNAYQKWKLTPAGATKLKVADSGGLHSLRIMNKQQEDIKDLTPEELQIRRERNRKHAKKSRLRKKSLTTDLEQSLEVLREENANLRKLIEEHIARKKAAAAANEQSVDRLLEKHRVRSHERFIECLIANSGKSNRKRKSKDSNNKKKVEKKKKTLPSGRGIIVDDKTVKLLKGLSKSISFVSDKPQKE